MRNNRIIHLWYLLDSLNPGNGIYVLYLSQALASATLGMTIIGIEKFAQALFEVPTGILSDKIGRKNTFVFMACAALVGAAFYAFSNSFIFFAIAAITNGLSRSLFSGSVDAYVFESLRDEGKEKDFGKVTAKLQATWQTGMIASTIVAAGVSYFFDLRLVMIIGVIPLIIALVISFLLTNPKSYTVDEMTNVLTHFQTSLKLIFSDIRLRTLTLTNVFHDTLSESGYAFRNVFLATLWPVWATNLSLLINKIFGAITFTFAHKYIDRFGSVKSLIHAVMYSSVIRMIASAWPTIYSPVIIQTGQLGYGVEVVAVKKLQQEYFTDTQRATLGSIESFASSLLISIVAPIIGYIADKTTPGIALTICYTLQLGGNFGYIYLGKVLNEKKRREK
ncbi:MAG: MFS transporter [Patescibacteria group bacterium]